MESKEKTLKEDPESGADESADGWVEVSTGKGYRTDMRARGHRLVADEPVPHGGTNAGPDPYDYLVAALGSCTSMTIRMYADRKGWPLESVRIRLRHQKVHAEDCEECETKSGKIDLIEREVELIGTLNEAQRERLLQIADKCPVHRTLQSEILVRTRLKD